MAAIEKMQRLDVPSHLAKIGNLQREGWMKLEEHFGVPVTIGGRPEMTLTGFDHEDGNALMTFFTRRMLDRGFLAGGYFNPTMAHEPHHVSAYLKAAETVFPEIAEAIEKGDVLERIDHKPKHTMFARLT